MHAGRTGPGSQIAMSASTAPPPVPTSGTGQTYASWLDELPLNRRHWRVFGVCSAAFIFDSLDFQVLGLAAPSLAREWTLDPHAMGLIFSTTPVGMLVGSYLFGMLSDRIGRRIAFQVTVLLFSLFAGLCAAAPDPITFAALRFMTGVGIGGFIPVDTAMMTEFMPSRHRGRMLGMWATSLPFGNLLAAAVGSWVIPELGWRALFLLGAVPGVAVFLVRWAVPESPRFLLSRGRTDEARASLAWVAGHEPPDGLEAPAPTDVTRTRGVPVLDLFKPPYRRRTAMLWAVWSSWSFSYFGLIIWLPSLLARSSVFSAHQVYLFVIGFSVSGIVGRLVVASLVDRVGRKPILLAFGAGAVASALFTGFQTTGLGIVLGGFTLAFFHDGGAGCYATWTPELYPTRVRTTGVGCANATARLAAIASPIAIGLVVGGGAALVFTIFAAGYAIATLAVAVLGTETKGMHLEAAALEAEPADTPEHPGAPHPSPPAHRDTAPTLAD